MKKIFLLTICSLLCITLSAGNDLCGTNQRAFQAGEKISYTIFYSALGIYVNAGTASFTTSLTTINNRPVYHAVGIGYSNSSYDWIFKVRDRYESYIDTATMHPLLFIRNVEEGGYKKYEKISFNRTTNTATSLSGVYKVPNCVQDVISAIFYARNLNFNAYNVGDKIPFSLFIDNELYSLYIKYLGREIVKTKYGKFYAIKFKPLLVKGTLFEGGEKMTVWVSDDDNHIPLRIESPITVGSVKIDMFEYKNLKYPFSSLVSFK